MLLVACRRISLFYRVRRIISLVLFVWSFKLYYSSVFYGLVLVCGLLGHKELVSFAGRLRVISQLRFDKKSCSLARVFDIHRFIF